jgi:hypothetical protein
MYAWTCVLKLWNIIVSTMAKSVAEKKLMYTLAEKLDIVKQAYNDIGNTAVKLTAKKYYVQPRYKRKDGSTRR